MTRPTRTTAAIIALFALATITTTTSLAAPKGITVFDIPPSAICAHLAKRTFTTEGIDVNVTPLAHREAYTIAFVRTPVGDAPVLLHATATRCSGTYLNAGDNLFNVDDLAALGVPDDVATALVHQQTATIGPSG